MSKKVFFVFLSLVLLAGMSGLISSADSAEYVGAKKCKACHNKQYKAWKKTAMANSFEDLKSGIKAEEKKKAGLDPDKDYTTDKNCLKCHKADPNLEF